VAPCDYTVDGAGPGGRGAARERGFSCCGLANARLLCCGADRRLLGTLQSTGLDPEGVALRASEGLAAVDFLMPGYFVWGKIIEALADVGYETNNLVRESPKFEGSCRSSQRCSATRPTTW
jgi:Lecithin:cholesterol acyltransferase